MQNGDIFNQLTPEQMHQLLGLSTVDDESQLLQDQLAQAEALRSHYATGHSTGLGAALGGLGDILNASTSKHQQGVLRAQQQALLQQKLAGRSTFADLLRQPQQPGALPAQGPGPAAPQSQGMGPTQPMDVMPFGWGGY